MPNPDQTDWNVRERLRGNTDPRRGFRCSSVSTVSSVVQSVPGDIPVFLRVLSFLLCVSAFPAVGLGGLRARAIALDMAMFGCNG